MLTQIWTVLCLAAFGTHMATAKTVMAHFMMSESYAFDIPQWKTDMAAAQQIGVDGFALNWIPPDCTVPGLDWQVSRIDDAFTAAESVGFKLMFSFDMSYTECSTYWNQTFMQSMITKYASSSATYRWNTNILVSTYGGDTVTQYGNLFFQGLKNNLKAAGNAITLVPALTSFSMAAYYTPAVSAASLISSYPSIDGYLNWQAWPLTDANMTTTADAAFKSALTTAGKTGPYIMAISPWQYKDLNDGVSADAWVSYSDTLFAQRLQALATNGFSPDIVELLTWNDYCESHYLRDVPSTVETAKDYVTYSDGMQNYVNNQSHGPWRTMAKYYISWWKNGVAPKITMDQVVYWYRIHPKTAVCLGGSSTAIRNYLYPVDAVFAWALVQSKATISVSVGSNSNWTFQADGSGPVTSMVPFPAYLGSGVTPQVSISRNGKQVATSTGSLAITSDCAWQNFNPVVNLAGQGINK